MMEVGSIMKRKSKGKSKDKIKEKIKEKIMIKSIKWKRLLELFMRS